MTGNPEVIGENRAVSSDRNR